MSLFIFTYSVWQSQFSHKKWKFATSIFNTKSQIEGQEYSRPWNPTASLSKTTGMAQREISESCAGRNQYNMPNTDREPKTDSDWVHVSHTCTGLHLISYHIKCSKLRYPHEWSLSISTSPMNLNGCYSYCLQVMECRFEESLKWLIYLQVGLTIMLCSIYGRERSPIENISCVFHTYIIHIFIHSRMSTYYCQHQCQ